MTESEARKIAYDCASKVDIDLREKLQKVICESILLHQPPEPAKAKTRGEIVAEKAVYKHAHTDGFIVRHADAQCLVFGYAVVSTLRPILASLIDAEIAREREECAKVLDRCGVNLISASAGAEMIRAPRD